MAANSLTGENIQLPIYKADGTSFEGLVLRKSVYESVVMSLGDKITGDVYYANNQLSVQMNEYVVYDNVKYVLVNPPTILREGMVGDNGELRGMTKYSFTFYHPMYMLGNFPFSDVAVSTDQQRYLSENKTFFWIGNLVDYVAKINKNLETTEWYCEISNSVQTIDRNKISEVERFDKNTIAEALKRGYEIWEIPYIISTISSDSSLYAQGKRFLIQYGLPTTEILVRNGQDEYVPFVFHFGQGVGLKNNSRTPRNNKIVTRIAGYGSENNIPYGYPQIPYTGGDCAYPLYYGIVGGQRVQLIKHPFTRNHLMPSIYRETVNKKVNPMAVGYDPTIEIKDYYDADGTYENPIKTEEPSYEIHEFDKIKPELGEKAIVDAYAINDAELDTSAMLKSKFISDVTDLATSTEIETERNQLVALIMAISVNRAYNSSGSDDSYEYTCATHLNYGDGGLYANIEYTSSNVNFQYVVRLTSSSSRVEWDDTMDDNGEYKQSYFKIVLPVLSFDLYASAAVTQEMTINMRSGDCLGCSFPVMVDWDDYKVNFYDSEGNFAPDGTQRDLEKYPDSRNGQITLILQKETTTFGTLMPNIYQKPSGGDKFVILGISLPTSYITEAEERLDTDMKQYMRDNNVYYYDYPLKFDEHFLVNHTDILNQMKNNVLVRFDYAGEEHALYIKQISIKYENKPLPTYDITLTDDIEIVLNKIGQVTDEVSKLRLMMGGGGASVESDKYLRKDIDDTAYGTIRLIKGLQVGERFVTGLLGEGGVFRKDADGTTYIEADKLYIRMKAYFDTVEVKHYLHSGGNRIATKASGINCSRVEYIDEDGNVTIDVNNAVKFRCYFKATGNDKTIRNDFVVGDFAFCKETNVDIDEIEQHGYWRMVVGRNASNVLSENNEAWIDLSNRQTETIIIGGTTYTHNGYMSGSDVPIAQDDIIQLGNINDTDRQGAIIEYVGGEDAPSYQIFQGINDFSLNGKNYIGLGYSTQTGRAYLNVYGDAYIGDPNGSTYLRYDAGNRTLNIKAVINAQSTIDGKTIAEFIAQNTWTEEQITDMITDETDPLFADIDTALDTLQKQVDGSVETWFYNGVPSSSVLPESEWKAKDQAAGNNNERLKHLGDLYYDNQTGYAYRYTNQGTEKVPQFVWNPISDSAVVKALADAAKAQDTADHKRRVFVNQPVPPYDEGDLWSNATYPTGNTITDAATNKYHNDVLRCRTSKESGQSFSILDWTLASKYTDDSALTSFINSTYANDKLNLQNQIDGKAETWYQDTDPSQSWTTAEQKASHEGDLWYDTDTGETFYYDGTKWNKQNIPAEVFDTIDGKSSIYTSKPTSYKKNDIWILEADYKLSGIDYQKGELVTATQDSESFNAAHWTKKVKYTDDAALNEFKANQYVQQLTNGVLNQGISSAQQAASQASAEAAAAQTAADNAQTDATAANNKLLDWADDEKISPTEKLALKNQKVDVEKEYAQILADAGRYSLTSAQKTEFTDAYNRAMTAFTYYTKSSPENIAIITDGQTDSDTTPRYSRISAYYTARQTIMDAISVAAKKVATDAQAKADSAYTLAGSAEAAAQAAEAHAATMDYVKTALKQDTIIDGGLVISTLLALRDGNNRIWSGINGAYKSAETGSGYKGHGIAAWYGGAMVDKEVTTTATDYAKSLFRFDGSGYVASKNISWDKNGNVTIQGYSINATTLQMGGSNVVTESVLSNYVTIATAQTITGAKTFGTADGSYIQIGAVRIVYDATNNALKIVGSNGSSAANLYATGSVSALGAGSGGSSGGGDVTWALLASSSDTRQIALSHLTSALSSYATQSWVLSQIAGSSTGGTVTAVKVGSTSYSPTDGVVSLPAYPTSETISGVKFSWSGSVSTTDWFMARDTSVTDSILFRGISPSDMKTLLGVPSKVSQLTNDAGYLTSATKLDIGFKSQNDARIGSQGFGVFLCRDCTATGGDGAIMSFDWNSNYCTQFYLDTDATYNLSVRNYSNGTWNAWKEIITSNNIASQSVAFAAKLATARTIWGQSFDGSANVSGNISNVGSIVPSETKTKDLGSSTLQFRNLYTQWVGAPPNETIEFGANNGYHISIDTAGKVGIGTRTPSYKLHVNGSLGVSNGTTLGGTLGVSGATTLSSTLSVSGLLTASGGITIPSGKTLKIGDAELSWDSTNQGIKITKGLYSQTFISALGTGGGGSSGTGDVTWALLASSSDTRQIALSHLTGALSGYATQSWVNSQISASATGGTVTAIKVGTATYNPSSGVVSLPAYPTSVTSATRSQYLETWNSDKTASYGDNYKFYAQFGTNNILYLKCGNYPVHADRADLAANANSANLALHLYKGRNDTISAPSTYTGYGTGIMSEAGAMGSTWGLRVVSIPWADSTGGFPTAFFIAEGRIKVNQASSADAWGSWNTVAYTTDNVASATKANGLVDGSGIMTSGYSKEGLTTTSWLAAWYGYELRAISPSNVKTVIGLGNVDNTADADKEVKRSVRTKWIETWLIDKSGTYGDSYKVRLWWEESTKIRIDGGGYNVRVNEADILVSSRTLWGQSFDGSANVSGNITGAGKIECSSYGRFGGTSGIYIGAKYDGTAASGTIERAGSGNMLYFQYYNAGGINMCQGGGNVGIGTTSPSYKLHVNGTAYTTRLYLASGVYLEYDSTNGGIHVVGAGLYSDSYISALGSGSGGSGSGGMDQATADARYLRLTGGSINGNVSISSVLTSTTVKGSAAVIAGSYLTVGSSSVNQSYNMYVNGTSRLANLVVANGTQGTVNCVTLTTRSSYGIYINTGNAPAYTKVGWSTVSDIRRKNIVRYVGASIEQIASAPIFDFRWKEDGASGKQMLGTSAQHWQSVFPCAVSDFGIVTLDYGATALAAAVVTARKVQDHEERILELERENERLRKELEELKAA